MLVMLLQLLATATIGVCSQICSQLQLPSQDAECLMKRKRSKDSTTAFAI